MWSIVKICGLFYVFSGAIVDYKTMRIPVWYLLLGTVGTVLYRLFFIKDSPLLFFGGFLIGVSFLLVSYLTRQAIGFGDSWMITILGSLLGTWEVLSLLFISFLALSCSALFLVFRNKMNRRIEIPFFPFLLVGYIGVML